MRRNFTPDQLLTDQLLSDNSSAFEELYNRYWFSLYSYSLSKLKSPENAKQTVRVIFTELWEQRHSLPVNFSVSGHLYTEVRKKIISTICSNLAENQEQSLIENEIIPEFSIYKLNKARRPVSPLTQKPVETIVAAHAAQALGEKKPFFSENQFLQAGIKGLKNSLQLVLSFSHSH
jgi:DNA-directed RNA polymerase specialized sigma24 family protein